MLKKKKCLTFIYIKYIKRSSVGSFKTSLNIYVITDNINDDNDTNENDDNSNNNIHKNKTENRIMKKIKWNNEKNKIK